MDFLEITNGYETTNYLGRKSFFEGKVYFLQSVINEYILHLHHIFTVEEMQKITKYENTKLVAEGVYCRFYPRPVDDSTLYANEGYMICPKVRGAFEVYNIDYEALIKDLKEYVKK